MNQLTQIFSPGHLSIENFNDSLVQCADVGQTLGSVEVDFTTFLNGWSFSGPSE
jgi:hypothetical protein